MVDTRLDVARKARRIYELLLAEYGQPAWRPSRSGFEQLIHTILSANTNDRNAARAFETLKQRFAGDWDAVRTAPLAEIKDAIRVAGMYNQKAPHIVGTLEILHREEGQYSLERVREMESETAQAYLQRFPGVGHKTASIVLLFNYGMAAFPVDTHIQRQSQRLGVSGRRASAQKSKAIWEAALPAATYFALHVNLIQHGRAVCQARVPKCAHCVLQNACDYAGRKGAWADNPPSHPEESHTS